MKAIRGNEQREREAQVKQLQDKAPKAEGPSARTGSVRTMDPKELRTDGGTQMRAKVDPAVKEQYREAMERGDRFDRASDPVVAYFDGKDY